MLLLLNMIQVLKMKSMLRKEVFMAEYSEKKPIDIISFQEDNADTLTSSSEDEAESSRLEN